MIVITAGEKYVDIDALACAVAYKELLKLQNKDAVVVFQGSLNHSVSNFVKKYNFEIQNQLPVEVTGYVIVDVSEPSHISSFVKKEKVISIFDHHFGFLDFWEDAIGKEKVKIEMIGACATLIWEEFKNNELESKISKTSASLLVIAIISNTFNLGVSLTSKRDIDAYNELLDYSDLPNDWKETYFKEQEEEVFKNTAETIKNDTKIQEVPNLNQPLVIGQIELWNGKEFLEKYIKDIQESLSQYNNPYWMMNIPSISEKNNYIYTENQEVKDLLQKALGWNFNDNLYVTKELVLRKQILKALYDLKP